MKTYLLKIQFLGLRYHGWMLQPNVKTVQGQLEKTLRFIYPEIRLKTLACGRTDAMVSADEHYVELFIAKEVEEDSLLKQLTLNLPQDIRVLEVKQVDADFNVINDVKQKEYHYLFTDLPMHPFCASMMTYIREPLDLQMMQQAAEHFQGRHWFGNYCAQRRETKEKQHTEQFYREIQSSKLQINREYQANFFPERTYLYKIVGKGFMRYQVRMMMGAMLMLGNGQWSWQQFLDSLDPAADLVPLVPMKSPASGLILKEVHY